MPIGFPITFGTISFGIFVATFLSIILFTGLLLFNICSGTRSTSKLTCLSDAGSMHERHDGKNTFSIIKIDGIITEQLEFFDERALSLL